MILRTKSQEERKVLQMKGEIGIQCAILLA